MKSDIQALERALEAKPNLPMDYSLADMANHAFAMELWYETLAEQFTPERIRSLLDERAKMLELLKDGIGVWDCEGFDDLVSKAQAIIERAEK